MVGKPGPQKPKSPAENAASPEVSQSGQRKSEERSWVPSNRNAPSQGAASALTASPDAKAASPEAKAAKAARREASAQNKAGVRLVSLDAFRGFIMMMLAANGFGLLAFSRISKDSPIWASHDRELWKRIGEHFDHPAWVSSFDYYQVSFWDLIQPSFMFMVGVAMPYSYARRESQGQSRFARMAHALIRSVVLILMGVFLSSLGHERTNWVFPNVLCQIGLGYFFASLLLNRGRAVQFSALAVILAGCWGWFYFNPPPVDYDYESVSASKEKGEVLKGSFAPWSKNANPAFFFDQWLLPKLRSAPEEPVKPVAALVRQSGWQPASLIPQDSPQASPVPETAAETPASEPAASEPAASEPAASEPAASEPAASEPTAGNSTAGDNAANDGSKAASPATDSEPHRDSEPDKDLEPDRAAGATGWAMPDWLRRTFFSNTEPYTANAGGYTTLNFIPSIATTLLGILCGQLLMIPALSRWAKLGLLVAAASVCLGLGIAADQWVCPVVKRIWTPSWVLFSGGYVIGMLALFYLLFDIAPLKFLAFPLVVVGMNSILTYMLGQTLSGWMRESVVKVHLSGLIEQIFGPKALDPQWFGSITVPATVFLLYWLFLLWLYRQRIFLRI